MLEVRLERAKRTNNDTTKCMNTSIVNQFAQGLMNSRKVTSGIIEGDRDWMKLLGSNVY
jgi:hypothetical protein